MVGTQAYLAPEIRDDNMYDASCDVYSVGVVAMEMVLRECPEATHAERQPQIERAAVAHGQASAWEWLPSSRARAAQSTPCDKPLGWTTSSVCSRRVRHSTSWLPHLRALRGFRTTEVMHLHTSAFSHVTSVKMVRSRSMRARTRASH